MLNDVTRPTLIQFWFAAAVLLAAGMAFGGTVTVGTGVMLFGLSLFPPAILLVFWPRVQPLTVSEVLHGVNRGA